MLKARSCGVEVAWIWTALYRRVPVMTQAPVSHSVPTAPDYDRTLVLAIELSNKSWVLAAQVP